MLGCNVWNMGWIVVQVSMDCLCSVHHLMMAIASVRIRTLEVAYKAVALYLCSEP